MVTYLALPTLKPVGMSVFVPPVSGSDMGLVLSFEYPQHFYVCTRLEGHGCVLCTSSKWSTLCRPLCGLFAMGRYHCRKPNHLIFSITLWSICYTRKTRLMTKLKIILIDVVHGMGFCITVSHKVMMRSTGSGLDHS